MPYGDCSSVYVTLLLMHSYFLLCRKSIFKTLMSNKKKSNFIFVIPEKLSPTKKKKKKNCPLQILLWIGLFFTLLELISDWKESKVHKTILKTEHGFGLKYWHTSSK